MTVIRLPTARASLVEVDQPEATLPVSVAGPTKAALLTVLLGLGGLALWAATAPLASGAVALGQIQVDNNRKTIQHLEGGIIKDILVRDGDLVHAGQILVLLDGTRLRAGYKLLEDKLDQDDTLIARLVAERDGQDQVRFSPEILSRADVDQGLANIIDEQRQQFTARRASLTGQLELLRQSITEYQQQIKGYQAQITSKETQTALMKDQLSGLQFLFYKGLAPKTQLIAVERDLAEAGGSIGTAGSQIAAARVAIEQTQAQILQTRRKFLEDSVEKLREINADRLDVKDRMAAQRTEMERLEIRSPIGGQIVGLAVHTRGGVVSPGEHLMDIIPADDRLVVAAEIPPREIEHVKVGYPAEVRLVALRQRTTPTLMGSVTVVSSDTVTDPATHQSFYTARVEIPRSEMRRLDKEALVAGMPAEILIKSGKHTVLRYLMSPILDAMFESFHQD